MPNDLQLSDQDEVLLESLVLAASDNVTRAPGADRSQFAPTRRRVFVETDGNENVYLGTGNAWVDVSENTGLLSSLFGGGDGNFDSVNTNRVVAGGLRADAVTGGGSGSLGMEVLGIEPEMYADYVADDILEGYDPSIYHKSHFGDGKYRVTITDGANSQTDLYTTEDFQSFNLAASEIFSSGSDAIRVHDHIVLPDGRFAVFTDTNESKETDLRVGSDLTNLSLVGSVISDGDVGAIRDGNGTIHYYGEDYSSSSSTFTVNIVTHYTAPVGDPTNTTQQDDAIDVSPFSWETGDPDLVNIGGQWLMFLDRKTTDPYKVAVAYSRDLYDWGILTERLTKVTGGDMAVTSFGGRLAGLTESSGSDLDGIGVWSIRLSRSALGAVRSSSVVHEFQAGTKDGVEETTNGGTIDLNLAIGPRLEVSSGSTTGNYASGKRRLSSPFKTMSWKDDRVFKADLEIQDVSAGGVYLVTGDIGAGSSGKTNEHIGIGATGGDIIGTVADGSKQTTTTLISGAQTGLYKTRVEYHALSRSATFYINGEIQGSVSTNLPSPNSDIFAETLWKLLAETDEGDTKQINLYHLKFGQAASHRGP